MPGKQVREQRTLTDPRAMRAIAHPTRLALLEALGTKEPLTATEAAELVGESPTNCAFHLRTLAKYGFVEEAGPAPGRRRPWQRTHIGFRVGDPAGDPQAQHASRALAEMLWTYYAERLRTVGEARRSGLRPEWEHFQHLLETVTHVTRAEADELIEDVLAVLDRYRDRGEDATRRPADAVAVEWLFFGFPRDLAHRRGGPAGTGPAGAPSGGTPSGGTAPDSSAPAPTGTDRTPDADGEGR